MNNGQDTQAKLVLASGSPRRKQLLTSLGLAFEVRVSDIDETQRPDEAPFDYAFRMAQEKAAAVSAVLTDLPAFVLAADTIVMHQQAILGKPADADEARAMLRRLRGDVHVVCTAFALARVGDFPDLPDLPQGVTDNVYTTVKMRDYTDAEIDAYIETGDPFDKAGGYAIQHAGFHPVEAINRCYTTVMGLPLCAVRWALSEMQFPGITPPDPPEACDCLPFEGYAAGLPYG